MDDLISIIIPVYNMQKYIGRCLDSVLAQTYKNIEVIVVNDGSTDFSRKIIEKYIERDNRIKLVDKSNGGQGSARNQGLDVANGKWIGFVDSDDIISERMYEILHNAAVTNNCDILIADIVNWDGVCIPDYSFENMVVKMKFSEFYPKLLNDEITSHPANKLFRADLFENNRFLDRNSVDDMFLMPKVFKNAQNIGIISAKLYGYFFARTDSVSNTNECKNAIERYKALKERYDIAIEQGIDTNKILAKASSFGLGIIGIYISNDLEMDTNTYNEINAWMKTHKNEIFSSQFLDRKRKIAIWIAINHTKVYKLIIILKKRAQRWGKN